MTPPRAEPDRAAPPALRLLLVLAALALLVPYAAYLTDDSYIHFQFAKHVLRGEGFAFNAGEPTYGATSPLWVLLLAAVGLVVPGAAATPATLDVVPPFVWIAKGLGALAVALSVLAAHRLARRLGWSEGEGYALAGLLAFHAWSARWAVSGMESPLALLFVLLSFDALAATLLSGDGRRAWSAGALLAAAALVRPEVLLLALMALVALAVASPSSPDAGPGAGRRRAGAFALGFALPYGAWLAAAFAMFHRLVPNTSGAKAGAWFDAERGIAAIRDAVRIALAAEFVPLALAVGALAFGAWDVWRRRPSPARAFWLLVALWPVALVAAFALTGVQVVSRYLLIATPAVLLLGVGGYRHLRAIAPPRVRGARIALLLVLAIHAAEGLVVTFRVSAPAAREHAAGLRASLGSIGLWARANTPPSTRFAVADIGAFGYYSDRPVLDLYGLVTPPMGPIVVHEGYDRVVFDLRFESVGRPEYLVDRARTEGRLTVAPEPDNPYRFLFARTIPNLGITRPGDWSYSVYAIDWGTWDRLHPKLANR
ncbi:MAG TPA: hypothetical protein VFS09_09960 [Candidatus Eisenbacteria bacterium]|nr:hypothetical protein [Candidatus Eisenbacteria bacterium]